MQGSEEDAVLVSDDPLSSVLDPIDGRFLASPHPILFPAGDSSSEKRSPLSGVLLMAFG